jgi:hypothetical protein
MKTGLPMAVLGLFSEIMTMNVINNIYVKQSLDKYLSIIHPFPSWLPTWGL